MRIFVTGTDTNVGKTIISSWLCLHTGYAYCKPIQTGYVNGTDSDTIKQLTSSQVYQESFLYQAPLSPHLAASLENSEININHINIPNNNNIIIEGAGGIFVPINKHLFMIDLIKQINAPVILVARSTLGTINHTLLSLEALRSKNIPILGVILNKTSNQYFQDNLKAIEWYGKTTVLAHIPKLTAINKSSLLKIAFSTQLKTIFDMAHEII
jgi:dethiobiotin synthetase